MILLLEEHFDCDESDKVDVGIMTVGSIAFECFVVVVQLLLFDDVELSINIDGTSSCPIELSQGRNRLIV